MDEFPKVIGCRRKAAIQLLGRGNQPRTNKRHGHPRQYDATVADALRATWEATDACAQAFTSISVGASRDSKEARRQDY